MFRTEEKPVEVPAALQAAVDAGDVDKVKEMLKTPPEGMSKALQKKLIKNSEIAQKKAAKGGAAAPPPAAQEKKRPESAPAKAASAAAPAPVVALATGHETPQDTIVADLLEFLKSRVPDGTLAELSKLKSEMSSAITPQVNALRNAAYTEGFTAR